MNTTTFELVLCVEDRDWDSLDEQLSNLGCSISEREEIDCKVMWLKAQTDFDVIVEMTCQLVRGIVALGTHYE